MADGTSARRRRRSRAPHTPAEAVGEAATPTPPKRARAARDGRAAGSTATERGLRDLIGGGPSQLGVEGALRGRDLNRPTEQDLARAEEQLVIVRRNWKPLD